MLDKIPFNMLAIIFEMSLYVRLHTEIGLNSSKKDGSFSLGIKHMKVEFKAPSTFLDILDSLATLKSSSSNIPK